MNPGAAPNGCAVCAPVCESFAVRWEEQFPLGSRRNRDDIYDMTPRIDIPRERIAEFCRRHHIRRLSLFGSVIRDDFRPESDVDVLVEFEPGKTPGLAFFEMAFELSELLERKVDLNTAGFLSPYYRDQVLAEAVPVYDAA